MSSEKRAVEPYVVPLDAHDSHAYQNLRIGEPALADA
jgi:hypothetical protein